jgi:hypothetical protein
MAVLGRPTKYRKAYCEQVLKHLKTGNSLASFAASIGTHRQRLWEWREKYPDFQDACISAIELSQQWWERFSLQIATGHIFHADNKGKYEKHNVGMVQFLMKQRFKDYRNMSNSDQQTPLAVNISLGKDDLKNMSDEDVAKKVDEALRALNNDDDKVSSKASTKGVSKKTTKKPAKRKSKK